MVEAKCYFVILLVMESCFNGPALGFHPLVQTFKTGSLSHDNSESSSSEEQINDNYPLDEALTIPDKRGHHKNYLRFGRKDEDQGSINIIRPGENDVPMLSALYNTVNPIDQEKRMTKNFLRFGRLPGKNFLRFGREGPLENGLDLGDSSEELIKRGYSRNFLRFGKSKDRPFLRFGRSTDRQHLEENSSARTKRSILYDDDIPLRESWTTYDLGHLIPNDLLVKAKQQLPLSKTDKRGYSSMNFLRYGRDPLDLHFLRFGKRAQSMEENDDTSNSSVEKPMNRVYRGSNLKNFIRYG